MTLRDDATRCDGNLRLMTAKPMIAERINE